MQMLRLAERCLDENKIDCWMNNNGKALQFWFHATELGKDVRGNITLDSSAMLQSAMLTAYVYNDSWLLPLLRVVLKWARHSELIGTGKDKAVNSLSLCFMVIDHCLRVGAIQHSVKTSEVNSFIAPRC